MAQNTVNQTTLLAVETTPGTFVTPTKRLDAYSFGFTPKDDSDVMRVAGTRATNYEWLTDSITEIGIDGELDYSCIVYLLSGLISYAAPTTVTGVSTWAFGVDNTSNADVRKNYSLGKGVLGVANGSQVPYVQISSMDIDFTGKDSKLKAKAFGQQLNNSNINLSNSPTVVAMVKAAVPQWSFFANFTGNVRGSASQVYPLKCSYKIADRFDPLNDLSASATFRDTVERPLKITVEMDMQVTSANLAYLTALRAGSAVGAWIEATGPVIGATATNHSMKFNTPGVVTGVKEYKDDQGVYAFGVQIQFSHIAGSNVVDLVNGVAAL